MPRTPDPQPSEALLVARTRRRAALGVAALALVPALALAGCGNGVVKQRDDTRPEPNASTEGVRSVYPTSPAPTPQGPTTGQRSGPPSPGVGAVPSPF